MSPKPERDVTFPVTFHGERHYGVRLGTEELPMYFTKRGDAQSHLEIMIYRRQHGGAMPADLAGFAAARQKRGNGTP